MIDRTWLEYAGIEVVNGARTLAYLDVAVNAGLFEEGPCRPECASTSCCDDPATVGGPFGSGPSGEGIADEADRPPAPWWDEAWAASGEFLGVLGVTITELDGTQATRTLNPGAIKGGRAGRRQMPGRLVEVKATLLATSCAGMEYGQRWLTRALAPCVDCDTDTGPVRFLAACPPADDLCPERWVRVAPRAFLAAGPTYTSADGAGLCDCLVVDVEWTFGVESPYLFSQPAGEGCPDHTCDGGLIAAGDVANFIPAGDDDVCPCNPCRDFCRYPYQCCVLRASPGVRDVAPILTLTAGSAPLNGLRVEFHALDDRPDEDCGPPDADPTVTAEEATYEPDGDDTYANELELWPEVVATALPGVPVDGLAGGLDIGGCYEPDPPAEWSFVAAESGEGAAGDYLVPVPAGVVDGDLLVLLITDSGGVPPGVDLPDWTAVATDPLAGDAETGIFTRWADTEPGSYTIPAVGTAVAVIAAYRGIPAGTAIVHATDTGTDDTPTTSPAENGYAGQPYITAVGATEVVSASESFTYTGGSQDWVVPPGVHTIAITLEGAEGGEEGDGSPAGLGGRVVCVRTVTPGETLHIVLGGQGTNDLPSGSPAGGFNGGGDGGSRAGSGGGASDIRIGGTTLSDRVIVAGGAGGSGGNNGPGTGEGGPGGNTIAGPGGDGTGGTTAGDGGTSSGGGVAGTGGTNGTAGATGDGGDGGTNSTDRGGGGGGGGYYGGGGGGSSGPGSSGGGGGGGSSFTDGACSAVVHTPGVRSGDGALTITYLCHTWTADPAAAGRVEACTNVDAGNAVAAQLQDQTGTFPAPTTGFTDGAADDTWGTFSLLATTAEHPYVLRGYTFDPDPPEGCEDPVASNVRLRVLYHYETTLDFDVDDPGIYIALADPDGRLSGTGVGGVDGGGDLYGGPIDTDAHELVWTVAGTFTPADLAGLVATLVFLAAGNDGTDHVFPCIDSVELIVDWACPEDPGPDPFWQCGTPCAAWSVDGLPAGWTLEADTVRRTFTATDPDLVEHPGVPYVTSGTPGALRWPDACCGPLCVCLSGHGGLDATNGDVPNTAPDATWALSWADRMEA